MLRSHHGNTTHLEALALGTPPSTANTLSRARTRSRRSRLEKAGSQGTLRDRVSTLCNGTAWSALTSYLLVSILASLTCFSQGREKRAERAHKKFLATKERAYARKFKVRSIDNVIARYWREHLLSGVECQVWSTD